MNVLENDYVPTPADRLHAIVKRTFDIIFSTIAIVFLAPLLVCLMAAVRLTSPGPVFYSQMRVGRGGEAFKFYKFRSMRVDAENALRELLTNDFAAREEWEKYQKLVNDPRVTPIGKILRQTSLDELPQFWNVLRGDMSVVGPRPVTAGERTRYGDCWRYYCAVRPGITGLWQVSGRSSLTYEDRVRLDVEYVRGASILLDLKILLRTITVVLGMRGSY